MRKVVGWVAAIIAWLLATGVFAMIDNLFHVSAAYSIYAVFAIGIPILLALFSLRAAPNVLLKAFSRCLDKCGNSKNSGADQVGNDTKIDDRDKSYYASFPVVLEGYPLVYYYRNIKINALDSALFDSMVGNDDYSISVVPDQAGGAVIQKDGKTLGTISKYGSIIDDWQKRGEPMLCKITSLKEGRESVGLGFYRDMQAKLSSCEHSVVRLTKNRSQDMQDAVASLEDGEMLDIFPEYMDEEDAIPVQSKIWGEVGFLPKKFNKIYEETGIRGVFVDHVEENENFKYTAYVRVYW